MARLTPATAVDPNVATRGRLSTRPKPFGFGGEIGRGRPFPAGLGVKVYAFFNQMELKVLAFCFTVS